jgi:hypothetical protein
MHRGPQPIHDGGGRRRDRVRPRRRDPAGALVHPCARDGPGSVVSPGFAGGATAGLGGVVLLQEFCTLLLTAASAVGVPVVLGVVGAIGASMLRRGGTSGSRRAAQVAHGDGAGVREARGRAHRGDSSRPRRRSHPRTPRPGTGGGGPSHAPTGPLPPAPPPPSGGEGPLPVVPLTPDEDRTCPNCGVTNEPGAQFCTN